MHSFNSSQSEQCNYLLNRWYFGWIWTPKWQQRSTVQLLMDEIAELCNSSSFHVYLCWIVPRIDSAQCSVTSCFLTEINVMLPKIHIYSENHPLSQLKTKRYRWGIVSMLDQTRSEFFWSQSTHSLNSACECLLCASEMKKNFRNKEPSRFFRFFRKAFKSISYCMYRKYSAFSASASAFF